MKAISKVLVIILIALTAMPLGAFAESPTSISYATTTVNKVYGDPKSTNPLTVTGSESSISYTSSDSNVATVDSSTGEVTVVGAGSTNITATATYAPVAPKDFTFDAVTGALTVYTNEGTLSWKDSVKDKSTVKSLDIKSGVTKIGEWAFADCKGITSIKIPSSVTKIGKRAFTRCIELKSITISDGVNEIGYSAFEECTGLTSITLPSSVISVGEHAFDNCRYLESITFKSAVAPMIGNYVLSSTAVSLKVHVPKDGTGYTDGAWKGLRYSIVADVELSTTEATYAPVALNQCKLDSNSEVPVSTATASYTLVVAKAPLTLKADDKSMTTGTALPTFTYKATGLVNSDTITAEPVMSCEADGAKAGTYAITVSGGTVDHAGNYDITYTPGNLTVTAPEVVLPDYTFDDSTGALIIYTNAGTTKWKETVKDVKAVKTVDIQTGVESIYEGAFKYCPKLTSIIIPSSVTSIGDCTFYSCTGLTSLHFKSKTAPTVGDCALGLYGDNPKIYMPKGGTGYTGDKLSGGWDKYQGYIVVEPDKAPEYAVTDITKVYGDGSFINPLNEGVMGASYESSNTNVATVDSATGEVTVVGPGSTTIKATSEYNQEAKDYTFDEATGALSIYTGAGSTLWRGYIKDPKTVKTISLSNGVTFIGNNAFSGCTGLTSITIPSSVTTIRSSAFTGCTGLTYITIPSSVTSIDSYTFHGCTGLISITIPSSATLISRSAFEGCAGLTSITIPSSVTSIGYGAFNGCTKLKSITFKSAVAPVFGYSTLEGCKIHIPKGGTGYTGDKLSEGWADYQKYIVVPVPDYSFDTATGALTINTNAGTTSWKGSVKDTSTVKIVDIKNGVTSIGDYAFYSCTGLTSIAIQSSVTSIGDYAFRGCTRLTSITIPNNVTSIGGWAFQYCGGLTSITIPSSVTSIGNHAFDGCEGVTSITIPSSVTTIGTSTFESCARLTSITIPDGVTAIGDSAFHSCTGLTSIAIPSSVTSIGMQAFRNCTGLTSITIPSSVTTIDYGAFQWCTRLTSITIPSSVASIGYGAFIDCAGLTSITFKSAVAPTLEGDVFYNVSRYLKIHVPKDGTGYTEGEWADYQKYIVADVEPEAPLPQDFTFDTATGTLTINNNVGTTAWRGTVKALGTIKSINLQSDVTSIGPNAFQGCTGVTSLTIPSSVTSIDSSTFAGCTGLTSITIPSSVTTIRSSAFYGCTGLTSITIPSSVTSIDSSTFAGCTGLTSITIPSSVTSIGDYAFYSCTGLTSIAIPSSVTSIDGYTFTGCTGLTSITIPSSVTSIGSNAFFGCTGLTSITIPSSVTSIDYSAFRECTGLTDVTIPSSMTTIGDSAFQGCAGVTSLTIPDSVTSIGGYAFWYCTGLTSITFEAKVAPTLGTGVLYKVSHDLKIHIPADGTGYTGDNLSAGWADYQQYIVAPEVVAPDPQPEATQPEAPTPTATASYTLTVTKAPLTLKADDKSMTAGDALPTFTYTATGLVNGDTVTEAPTLATTGDGGTAGTYDINISAGTVVNGDKYDITYTNGSLVVSAPEVVMSYPTTNIAKTYGDQAFTNPLTKKDPADVISYASSAPTVATVDSATGEVTLVGSGSSTITATAPNGTTATYALTVAKATLTLKADNKSMVQGTAIPALTYTATGLVNGDTVTGPPAIKIPTNGKTVGTYDITISDGTVANGNNYNISYIKGTLTVKAPVVTISYPADAIAKVYGDKAFTNPLDETGKVGSVTFSSSDKSVASIDTATGEVTVTGAGDAVITAKDEGAGTASYTLSVSKALLELKADSKSMTQGTGLPGFTYTATGLVNGDKVTGAPSLTANTDGKTVGTYAITASAGTVDHASSYTITYTAGTLTVSAKPVVAPTPPSSSGGGGGGGSSKPHTDVKVEGDKAVISNNTKDGNVTVNLPKVTQEEIIKEKIKSTEIVTEKPAIAINLNLAAITAINKQANADVQLAAKRTEVASLGTAASAAIGARPAYDLKASYASGTKHVKSFGDGEVTIEIPYTLQEGEVASNVCVVYVDDNGKVTYLPDSKYDTKTHTVKFTTNHFSVYGVGYKTHFKDIKNHWAESAIQTVADAGLMSGTSVDTFSPNTPMTRGMFITTIGRMQKAPTDNNNTKFVDVKPTTYYAPYIAWATSRGLVSGTSETTFSPDTPITREQMAVIMSKAFGTKLTKEQKPVVFKDGDKIASWAKDAVSTLQQAGVLSGRSDGTFDPKATATRAEVASILNRLQK